MATNGEASCQYWECYFDTLHIGHGCISFDRNTTVQVGSETETIELVFLFRGSWQRKLSGFDNPLDMQVNHHNIIYAAPFEGSSSFSSLYNSIDVLHIHISPAAFLRYLPNSHPLFNHFRNSITTKSSAILSPFSRQITPRMHRLIQEILHCTRQGIIKRVYYESKVLELLVQQLEQFMQEGDYPDYSLSRDNVDRIHAVQDYIINNINQPITLTYLAKMFGTNEFTLKRGFKEVFGTTVFGFWNDLKMHQAKSQLLDEDTTITDISFALGYKNARHFSTAFKRKFGISPREMRKGKSL